MADIATYQNNKLAQIERDVQHHQKVIALPNAAANSGDNIAVYAFPAGINRRLTSVVLRTSGTLGASCTLQARVNRGGTRTVLTAATTAGAASKVDSSAQAGVPFDIQGGDVLELLVGGANIGAAATVTLDFEYTSR